MPKNKGKGGKKHKRGKGDMENVKREIVFKEDGQEYGQVLRMLGNGRCDVNCFDGVKRLCVIRGKMRKKIWVMQGDIVLCGLRDFQDEKADIIIKYNSDEARQLKHYGELPDTTKINEAVLDDDDGSSDGIEFGEGAEDDEIDLADI